MSDYLVVACIENLCGIVSGLRSDLCDIHDVLCSIDSKLDNIEYNKIDLLDDIKDTFENLTEGFNDKLDNIESRATDFISDLKDSFDSVTDKMDEMCESISEKMEVLIESKEQVMEDEQEVIKTNDNEKEQQDAVDMEQVELSVQHDRLLMKCQSIQQEIRKKMREYSEIKRKKNNIYSSPDDAPMYEQQMCELKMEIEALRSEIDVLSGEMDAIKLKQGGRID